MANRHLEASQQQRLIADCRGALIYRRENGYMLITILVDLHAPDERSSVLTRLGNLDIAEEAEHIPASLPLTSIDVYHFAVTDGTEIELTISCHTKESTVHYIVDTACVLEQPSFLSLDIIESSETRCGLSRTL